MYTGTCNGNALFDLKNEQLNITAGKLSLELNKAGSFQFTVLPDNPCYTQMQKFKTYIEVFKNGLRVFSGRVYHVNLGFHNEKQVICEGSLAFFNDSVFRPYNFQGGVEEFLEMLIDNHNSQVDAEKQFKLGNVTVTDPNDYIVRSSENPEVTMNILQEKMVKLLGGYLWVRKVDGVNYLDYLEDFNVRSNQEIDFGENLLNITRESNSSGKITALIPLGARLEPEGDDTETEQKPKRVTIESVNGGVDYIEDTNASAAYGRIFGFKTWDDVTEPSNLLTKARAFLTDAIKEMVTIKISAVDLSNVSADIDSMNCGEYVKVKSSAHNLDDFYLIKKQSIDLFKPSSNKIEVGETKVGYIGSGLNDRQELNDAMDIISTITKDYTLNEIVQVTAYLSSLIEQTDKSIRTMVSETYLTDDDLSEIRTSLSQNSDSFNFLFNEYNETNKENETKFQNIERYIKFIKGKIIIGEKGNKLTLVIANEKISFYENYNIDLDTGTELAYLQSMKLYIPKSIQMPVGSDLTLGKFAFVPRSNGNTSFKFVG